MFETWLWTAAFGLLAYVLIVMTYSRLSSIHHVDKIGYFMAICDIRKEMRDRKDKRYVEQMNRKIVPPKGGSGTAPHKPN